MFLDCWGRALRGGVVHSMVCSMMQDGMWEYCNVQCHCVGICPPRRGLLWQGGVFVGCVVCQIMLVCGPVGVCSHAL